MNERVNNWNACLWLWPFGQGKRHSGSVLGDVPLSVSLSTWCGSLCRMKKCLHLTVPWPYKQKSE